MTDWMRQTIEAIGYFGVLFLTFIENVFPPIPSEIVIPFAGFTAQTGDLNLIGVIIAATAGTVIGALPLYYLGTRLSLERIEHLADQYLKYIGFDADDIRRGMEWMREYGRWAVFLCRMVPGLRSVISIPAGITGMNLGIFLVLTTLGSLLWTIILAVAGYVLGTNYTEVKVVLDRFSWLVVLGLVLWYVWHLAQHFIDSETDNNA